MDDKPRNQDQNIEFENQVEPIIEDQPMDNVSLTDYNVMPDGMLQGISPTDLALLAIAKDAPRIPEEEHETLQQNQQHHQQEHHYNIKYIGESKRD